MTSPMTPSPPTPWPSCAGSASSTAICLPHWPTSTTPSRWPARPEIRRLVAYILSRRAVFKSEAGDLDTAFADNQEAITLSRAAGDNYRLATTLANLAIDEQATGKLRAARAHLQEASTLADDLGYQNLSAGSAPESGSRRPHRRQSPPRLSPLPRQPGHRPDHRCHVVSSRRDTRPGLGGRRRRRPCHRRHPARRRRRTLRAGRTHFRGPRSEAARPRPCPAARHAGRCRRSRAVLRSRPHAQPGRSSDRSSRRAQPAPVRGGIRRHRSGRRAGRRNAVRRPACRRRGTGDSGAAGAAAGRRPDRRAACSCRSTRPPAAPGRLGWAQPGPGGNGISREAPVRVTLSRRQSPRTAEQAGIFRSAAGLRRAMHLAGRSHAGRQGITREVRGPVRQHDRMLGYARHPRRMTPRDSSRGRSPARPGRRAERADQDEASHHGGRSDRGMRAGGHGRCGAGLQARRGRSWS